MRAERHGHRANGPEQQTAHGVEPGPAESYAIGCALALERS